MTEPTLICQTCGAEIELTESLAAPLLKEKQEEFQRQLKLRDESLERERQGISKARTELDEAKAAFEDTVSARVEAERARITAEQLKAAKAKFATDLSKITNEAQELREELDNKNKALETAQAAEADFRKKSRDLETQKRELQLQIEKGIDAGLEVARKNALIEAKNEAALNLRERDLQIERLQKQIEDLHRKAEQKSQQVQGEAQELEIFSRLSEAFPEDKFERFGKGQSGGDCLQTIYNAQGSECGKILWESKRTGAWENKWLSKLKADQVSSKADLAIIVSQVLPAQIETFGQMDETWVTGFGCLIPVAGALRHTLIETAATRRLSDGFLDKASLVYKYVCSMEFRQRVRDISEAYQEMETDLRKEKAAITRLWAKREKQLLKMSGATSAVWGDLQGIAGKEIQEIDNLDVDLLGTGVEDAGDSASDE